MCLLVDFWFYFDIDDLFSSLKKRENHKEIFSSRLREIQRREKENKYRLVPIMV